MPPCYAFSMEPYELIRSRRKTLALEITRDCRVLVRAPMRMPETRILAFVESHGDWIARHLDGVTLGSDAFFPFGDNIERAHQSGVKYIVQPGGSIRDDQVISTCDKYQMVMAFTGMRLFHH